MNLADAVFSGAVLVASALTAGARAVGAGPLVVLSCVAVLLLAAALWLRRTMDPSDIGRGSRPSAAAWRPARRPLRLPCPTLLALGFLGALAYLVENVWQSWSAIHLETTLDAPPGIASLAPAVFALSTTSGRLLGQRAARMLTGRQMVQAGATIAALGTAVAATAGGVPVAVAGLVIAGLGTSVCAPAILSATGGWAGPANRASAISTVTTFSYLGFLIGPAAVGVLSLAADLRAALLVVAAVAIALAALSRTMPGPSPPATTPPPPI